MLQAATEHRDALRLGIQVHCLRFKIREQGLEAALAELAGHAFQWVEMVSFPGCRGNRWGDFGAAADLPAASIAGALRDAGLVCPSIHVTATELVSSQLDATLTWAHTLGIETIVLGSLPTLPASTEFDARLAQIQELNVIGERLRAAGFHFALHMQPQLWQPLNGRALADELPRVLDASLCELEFDPSGCIVYGIDPADYLARHRGRFFAVHLRDGLQPTASWAHVPALPLGEGTVDWHRLLAAAARSGVAYYFLEMEVDPPGETLAAINTSMRYLRCEGLLSPAAAHSIS